MRLPNWLTERLIEQVLPTLLTPPHQTIRDRYLSRWFLVVQKDRQDPCIPPGTPRSRRGQVYLHWFSGSDDARALHDHPWWNVSVVLSGEYREVLVDRVVIRRAGDVVFRRATTAHRIVVENGPVCTLFITGRRSREWGFRTQTGFIPWKEYTDA